MEVKEGSTVCLEVDGADGKQVLWLPETSSVSDMQVNLFSLQWVLLRGYVNVLDEVKETDIIVRQFQGGGCSEVATMTNIDGRIILNCRQMEVPWVHAAMRGIQVDKEVHVLSDVFAAIDDGSECVEMIGACEGTTDDGEKEGAKRAARFPLQPNLDLGVTVEMVRGNMTTKSVEADLLGVDKGLLAMY